MYSYNVAGQVLKKRLRLKRNIQITSGGSTERSADLDAEWVYDSEGRMTQTKYPLTGTTDANRVLNYGFDDQGRPKTMVDAGSGAQLVSNVAHDADRLPRISRIQPFLRGPKLLRAC